MKRQMGVAVLMLGMLAGCKKEKTETIESPPPPEAGGVAATHSTDAPSPQPIPDRPAATGPSHQPEGVIWDDFSPVNDPATGHTGPNGVTTQPVQTTYTVKKGDSLYNIARDHYGNGVYYTDILAANPGLTTDLTIGQKIILPAIPDRSATTRPSQLPKGTNVDPARSGMDHAGSGAGTTRPGVAATQPGQTVYIVKKGDSLYSIAQERYGSGEKYKDILAANPGLTKDLTVDQEIILP